MQTYGDLISGRLHSLSASFYCDPPQNGPIHFKEFVEASVTDNPVEPGAKILVRHSKAEDGTDVATHVMSFPLSDVKLEQRGIVPTKAETVAPSAVSPPLPTPMSTEPAPASAPAPAAAPATSPSTQQPEVMELLKQFLSSQHQQQQQQQEQQSEPAQPKEAAAAAPPKKTATAQQSESDRMAAETARLEKKFAERKRAAAPPAKKTPPPPPPDADAMEEEGEGEPAEADDAVAPATAPKKVRFDEDRMMELFQKFVEKSQLGEIVKERAQKKEEEKNKVLTEGKKQFDILMNANKDMKFTDFTSSHDMAFVESLYKVPEGAPVRAVINGLLDKLAETRPSAEDMEPEPEPFSDIPRELPQELKNMQRGKKSHPAIPRNQVPPPPSREKMAAYKGPKNEPQSLISMGGSRPILVQHSLNAPLSSVTVDDMFEWTPEAKKIYAELTPATSRYDAATFRALQRNVHKELRCGEFKPKEGERPLEN